MEKLDETLGYSRWLSKYDIYYALEVVIRNQHEIFEAIKKIKEPEQSPCTQNVMCNCKQKSGC